MVLFGRLHPDRFIGDARSFDYGSLRRDGVRGLIFDIDNTLVPQGAPADGDIPVFFDELRAMGFSVCFVSNNDEARVKPFADAAGASFVCHARKPSARGYEEALVVLGTEKAETVSVGDQIFTDTWGAHRAGLRAFYAEPVDFSTDTCWIHVKRAFEKPFLKRKS